MTPEPRVPIWAYESAFAEIADQLATLFVENDRIFIEGSECVGIDVGDCLVSGEELSRFLAGDISAAHVTDY